MYVYRGYYTDQISDQIAVYQNVQNTFEQALSLFGGCNSLCNSCCVLLLLLLLLELLMLLQVLLLLMVVMVRMVMMVMV